jgi:galactonate dehydratase
LKISEIKPFLVDERRLFVRVYTDEGIIGNGGSGLWSQAKLGYEAIKELSRYYVGKDPTLIEHHWQVVTRHTTIHFMGAVLSSAVSAIDIALWDILGKSVNLPVYQLLGGKCRDKIRVFNKVSGDTFEELAESASDSVKQGFTALRLTPFFKDAAKQTPTQRVENAVKMIQSIREAVGYEVDLGIEVHRRLTPGEAIVLGNALEPYKLFFMEDPIAPARVDALRYVASHVDIPIAEGERLYNIWQFKELIDVGVSLIRTDISLAGGFTHCKKIAAMAEASMVGILPHFSDPLKAAQIQLDAAIPNYVLHEPFFTTEMYTKILDEPVKMEKGYILLPEKPGIGLNINEDALENYPYKPWETEGAFHKDGSVADL